MFFYEPLSATACVSVLLYLAFLIGMNELSRLNKWVGAVIFIALPVVLTVFVWPHTAVEGTGAGTWFQWVKTYSCLAGAILGWLIVYFPAFQKKYIVCIPPIIFAINILEACIRDFQLTGVNGIVDGYMVVGGPWNVMNGIAGILNAICICGFFGIIVSRGKKKDYVWPDQLWFWIIGYDLWNFAYTYNSVSDRSMNCGLVLLAACTIPAFFISVIALIFNASVFIYQAYTIFGKKRNPFKQELYIDNPRFRRVYLESIDVPEGQREAALANLEEFGYVAAWDEKGRVKTMVERP